ncbi:MAG: hypothetical protein ABIE03_06310 [Patescibacteria group bacterium]|nr:hypothetical protein [Patescibacteria group bacterium]
MNSKRTRSWLAKQKEKINNSLRNVLDKWHLNQKPKYMDQLSRQKASFVIEAAFTAYGLKIPKKFYLELINQFYPGIEGKLKQGLTDNHSSLAGKVDGLEIYTPIKYSPVLLDTALEIGQVSPSVICKKNEEYILNFMKLPEWQFNFKFLHPNSSSKAVFNHNNNKFLGKKYVDACIATDKNGVVVISSGYGCEQNCSFCTYTQEKIICNDSKTLELALVLEKLIQASGQINACVSSGSKQCDDRGIVEIFTPMLKLIEDLYNKYPETNISLELELMPWQVSADSSVMNLLHKYYKMGFIKAINMNPELPLGIDRTKFMSNSNFGKARIPVIGMKDDNRGYLDTFKLLKKAMPAIRLAGLLVYGVKPIEMSWKRYSKLCLETISIFAEKGFKLLLQPVKIASCTPLADIPLVDPFWLIGSVLKAGEIHLKQGFHKQPKIGCVSGCCACDSSRSSWSLLKIFKQQSEKKYKELLLPWKMLGGTP